ncbi:hypothetical protein SK128_018809, partial [Halocaridina rubra]
DSRPPSRTKPVPPKKPERLSLQRTTSLQSVDEGPGNTRSPSGTSIRYNTLQTWPSLDNELQEREGETQPIKVHEHERNGYRSREHSYDRLQERSHYPFRERGHYEQMSNGDGGVRMVVSGSPVGVERLSRRPSPQGAASTSIHEGTPRRNGYRSHSPDSAMHLDSDHIDGQESDIFRAEIYTSPGHSAPLSSYSHHHHHHHPHDHHHLSGHSHYAMQAPLTPVTSRSSSLSVATSPRPHEQWC